ncbi:DJ-1/PfpI family protein [bacterium]|nr:DJ-1/PfpI family protein [bacterium]
MKRKDIYQVLILVYPGVTLLDCIGPNEVLANSNKFIVTFVSLDGSTVNNDHANLSLCHLSSISDFDQADVLLIPGGPGDQMVMHNPKLLDWIRKIDVTTIFTTSVCTGSLILAQAGLLKNKRACCHWAYLDDLNALGALSTRKRFIQDGKYITASGVSSGIDMALYLLKIMIHQKHSQEIRFGIEYFPNQVNLLSSYTLPRFLLRKLSFKARTIIEITRKKLGLIDEN